MTVNKYTIWHPVYEGEGEGGTQTQTPPTSQETPGSGSGEGEGETPNTPPPSSTPTSSKHFTQEDLNRILAEEKRKHQTTTKKAIDELNALRSKAQLTAEERNELDQRVEQLQNELLTKEQLAKKNQEKLQKQYQEERSKLEKDRDTWKTRFTQSSIKRSITDAAATNGAYNPSQIVMILQGNTRLVEELNSDGEPSGELIPKVRFQDTDKEGKPVTLDLTPSEAVKRMKEMDEYLNLFKGEGSGGLGQMNTGPGKQLDAAKLARDPAAYRRARQEGKIKF